MATTHSDGFTAVEHRIVQGREVRILRDPEELHIQWRPGRPVYYGVRVGDRIKNAASDVESVRIDEWEVAEITPERVVGRHVRTGEETTWDRETLEKALVVGRYATNLSEFALVTTHPAGSWAAYDPEAAPGLEYRGRPYLTVIAYGNNGEKYGRRYRFPEKDDATRVELSEEDPKIARLSETMRAHLDEVVATALEDDGYVVSPSESGTDAADVNART
ncbi:hypothetical protein [Halopelagius longus]|uniref:Uncharacterized protein n=1 Tax=Halopelagius longus TaxID=1236180 RepID=A0A1H0XT68_9EURY|nr:hypothetical protein [Halopelagius longus]RDI72081.1 hypothetical protein DWB78_10310 [Halopelagius longus]SDQ06147.1 hypothetical protein SAMN05216278_0170 [Halopelagius longus]